MLDTIWFWPIFFFSFSSFLRHFFPTFHTHTHTHTHVCVCVCVCVCVWKVGKKCRRKEEKEKNGSKSDSIEHLLNFWKSYLKIIKILHRSLSTPCVRIVLSIYFRWSMLVIIIFFFFSWYSTDYLFDWGTISWMTNSILWYSTDYLLDWGTISWVTNSILWYPTDYLLDWGTISWVANFDIPQIKVQ